MGRSSCGSWGAGTGAAPDIIDLDRFMRAGVRPSDPFSTDDDICERLLVDAGAGPKPVQNARARRGGVQGGAPSSAGESSRTHHKRYSHDSGLSGDSYARRSRRPHRRLSIVHDTMRTSRDTQSDKNINKADSVKAFRKVCERTLLDQQHQITRIAQLCERLTEERAEPRAERFVKRVAQQSASADTSEISSSSRSTKDQRRKDKHRSDECKTYKIIMNKLDELNRLFASRGRSPPAPLVRSAFSPPPRALHHSSSCSVSPQDKPVSTRLFTGKTPIQSPTPASQGQVLVERAVGDGSRVGSTLGSHKRMVVRAVTQACSLDIAPIGPSGNQKTTPNITIESVVKRDSSYECSGSSHGRALYDLRCGSQLDDTTHCVHAFHASTIAPRAHSLERTAPLGERRHERRDKPRGEQFGGQSLCSLCRGCWRSVRQYVTAQIFCRPDNYY